MSDTLPFDQRLPNETAKAWDAFCLYRDMGVGRSIDKAAHKHDLAQKQRQNSAKTAPDDGLESALRVKPAPRHWGEWAADNSWVERVRGYDDSLAAEAEREARAAHLARIAEHRDRRAKIGKQIASAASALLGKGLERLKSLEMTEIDPKYLAPMLRTAAAVAEAALNMEASALGIDELLRDLQDAEDEESAEGTEAGD